MNHRAGELRACVEIPLVSRTGWEREAVRGLWDQTLDRTCVSAPGAVSHGRPWSPLSVASAAEALNFFYIDIIEM